MCVHVVMVINRMILSVTILTSVYLTMFVQGNKNALIHLAVITVYRHVQLDIGKIIYSLNLLKSVLVGLNVMTLTSVPMELMNVLRIKFVLIWMDHTNVSVMMVSNVLV